MLTDHQGSVRDVIDDSGAVLNHLVYDSFGYTGRELDAETGLLYYRARYFAPAAGIVWVRTCWDTFLSSRRRYCSAL
ncbi:RHS repeat-associated core domain-containing protein [Leptolyngbya sp. PCC 6406]|uniref:RHS repeat-associated core domain-containing protein n=1 Tax=Leptolyngbya sp. PCC 6406 TaxID=1173264 RepID=UPI0002ACCF11|nr:RHS repeat-associated core domain-containing protein [Leptolyngbya sp. PCC 6406]